jgi:hypothetical protein
MTINEILAKYGLDEEKITSFLADMKAAKIFTTSEENMDIRHGKVKKDLEDMTKNFNDANATIEQLQKNNKNNEELQKSVTDYQAQLAAAQKQAALDRLEYNLKLEFMAEGAEDLDYVIFKVMGEHPDWKENPEAAFDDAGKIKGRDDIVSGTKTKLPTQFKASGGRKYEERKLPNPQDDGGAEPKDLADAMRMHYETKNE